MIFHGVMMRKFINSLIHGSLKEKSWWYRIFRPEVGETFKIFTTNTQTIAGNGHSATPCQTVRGSWVKMSQLRRKKWSMVGVPCCWLRGTDTHGWSRLRSSDPVGKGKKWEKWDMGRSWENGDAMVSPTVMWMVRESNMAIWDFVSSNIWSPGGFHVKII